jgi:hypothetical protein
MKIIIIFLIIAYILMKFLSYITDSIVDRKKQLIFMIIEMIVSLLLLIIYFCIIYFLNK